jgi:dTDP-4-amino-4,6-dideoxygalactose transaminase
VSLRHVPPAAAPLEWADLWHGAVGLLRPARAIAALEQSLRDELGVAHVFLVSSGRAGLTLILRALRQLSDRRRVVVPGYTCFSVAAAVAKADLTIAPCDLELETLDFDYAQLERAIADGDAPLCVLPTHLFGLPADMARVGALCRDRGVFVVEDAAQALGLTTPAGKLGTLGDVGFYSFDRGKTVTSGHGGAIVTNSPEIARELAREYEALASPGLVARVRTLVETTILSLLIDPSRFWIPASLPFLHLGETVYSTGYPMERLSGVEAGLLANWRTRARVLNEARARRVAALRQARPDLVPPRAGACIRLPILCGSRQERDRVYGTGRREGLGFSLMYPAAVTGIPELQGRLAGGPCPVAEEIAERLLTVPVHPLVSAEDAAAIEKVLEGVRPPVH